MRVNTNKRSRRVRFIRPWQTYSVGNEITPSGTHRDWLVSRGYCEPVVEPGAEAGPDDQQTEFAVTPPVAETTATRSARHEKRGRRKQHAVRT